jgi:hypothetical protein
MPPTLFEFAAQWRTVSAEMMVEMQEWRLQHPKATLKEIAEAKTLAIGTVRTPVQERGQWVVHMEGLSYGYTV